MASLLTGKTKRYICHNPASSYAAIFMFLASLGLVATGILMSKQVYKDIFEEVHELIANGFLVLVLLHIAGVIFHQYKHRDNIALSIISGQKKVIDGEDEIKSARPIVGLLFVAIIISSASYILSSYNTTTQTLTLPIFELPLGEVEGDEGAHSEYAEDHDEEYDDD